MYSGNHDVGTMVRGARSLLKSSVDFSIRNRLRLRRLARFNNDKEGDSDVMEALALIQRLRSRHVDGTLPALKETSVEQSWTEQIFAKVLGYRTLLSHDRLPYHLEVQTYVPSKTGPRQFSDATIGFFGVVDRAMTRPLTVASAEFKGPGASLDKPQYGTGYRGRSAVQQALDAAVDGGSRFALVSNFTELRLYDVATKGLLATVALPDVRTPAALADLRAHFDRDALLGPDESTPEGELAAMMDQVEAHPGHVWKPKPRTFTVVLRYLPRVVAQVPLYRLEGALQHALKSSQLWQDYADTESVTGLYPLLLEGGWVGADGAKYTDRRLRVSVSTEGELFVAASLKGTVTDGGAASERHVSLDKAGFSDVAKIFADVLYALLEWFEKKGAEAIISPFPKPGMVSMEMQFRPQSDQVPPDEHGA